MADINFEVTRVSLTTAAATNTQDITIAGFGTPKAAIFEFSSAVTDDTIAAGAMLGIGFTDGTRENCCTMRSEDNVASSNTARSHRTDCCITVPTVAGGHEGRLSFDQWITDGVRIVVDDQIDAAYLCKVTLINGSDVNAVRCDHLDDLGTGTSAIDITTVGFETTLLFMTNTGLNTAPSTDATQGILSFGIATNISATVTQRVTSFHSSDAQGLQTITNYIGNDSITGQSTTGSLVWDAVVEDFDSSGFSINPNANAGSDVIFYLALELTNSPSISLFDMEWPTGADYAETTPGFQPDFGMVVSQVGPTARNTSVATTGNGSFSLMTFDTNGIYTTSHTEDDGQSTMVAKSLSSNQGRILDADGSTDAVLGTYTFDGDGWDFSTSTRPSATLLGFGLAIAGDGGATGPAVFKSIGGGGLLGDGNFKMIG